MAMQHGGDIQYGIKFNVDQTGLNAMKTSLQQISTLVQSSLNNVNTKGLTDANGQLNKILETTKTIDAALESAFNVQLGTVDFVQFNQILKQSGVNLSQYQNQLARLGPVGQASFRNLATEMMVSNMQIQRTTTALDKLKTTFANTIRWSISSSILMGFTSSVQKAFSYVKELDKSLNNIMLVTEKSSDQMAEFARQANKAAQNLGQTTTAYTNASLIYYQQGLADAEVSARTETTLKAANVTKQSADAVSEQLTAVWNGYKVTAAETELYIDKLAKVAATTASDLEELSTGMSKVASAANIMGVDIDQLNGMLSTVISVTREAPESIGTSFKTIFARMSDIEAGLDTETTLGEYTQGMADLGFNVLDANGKIRDMGEVVEEIGNKWTDLTREQQLSLAQTMAGTRQYSRLLSLFDNWDMYTKAVNESANATGFLQQQQDEYMESMEAHLAQLKAASEGLYDSLFDTGSMNNLIDVFTDLIKFFDNGVQALGGGGNLLFLGLIGLLNIFSDKLAIMFTSSQMHLAQVRMQTANTVAQQEILNNLYVDNDVALERMIELKSQMLRYGGLVTAEEEAQGNAILKSINAEAEKINLLEKEKQELSEISQQMIGISLAEKDFSGESNLLGKNAFLSTQSAAKTMARNGVNASDLDTYINDMNITWAETRDVQASIRSLRAKKGGAKRTLNSTLAGLDPSSESYDADVQKAQSTYDDSIKIFNEEIDTANKKLDELTKKRQTLSATYKEGVMGEQGLAQVYKEDAAAAEQAGAAVDKLTTALQTSDSQAENARTAVANLNGTFKELGTKAVANLGRLSKGLKGDLNNSINSAQQRLDSFYKQAEQFHNALNTRAISQGFITMVTSISTTTMSLSMLGNMIKTLKNDSLSAGEKTLQVLQNIGFLLPMMISGLSQFGKGWQQVSGALSIAANQAKNNVAVTTMNNIATARGIELSQNQTAQEMRNNLIRKITNQLIEEEARARGLNISELTAEQLAELKSNAIKKIGNDETLKGLVTDKLENATRKDTIKLLWAEVAARAAKYWYIGLIIAAVGLLAAGIYAAAKADQAEAEALAAANEQLEIANTKYQEATEAVNTFKDAVSSYEEGIEAFEELSTSADDYKEKLEELNQKAKELIETYDLYGKYSYNEQGLIVIDPDALDNAENKLEKIQNLAEIGTLTARMSVEDAALAVKNKEQRKEIGTQSHTYTNYGSTYSTVRQLSENEYNALADAFQQVREESEKYKDVLPQGEEAITSFGEEMKAILTNDLEGKYGDINFALDNFNDYLSKDMLKGLETYSNAIDKATEASLTYAKEILKIAGESSVWGDVATKLATKEDGEVDAALEALFNEAFAYISSQTGEEIIKKAGSKSDITNAATKYDANNAIEGKINALADRLGVDVDAVSKKLSGIGYDGDTNTEWMYKRYLQAQGHENVVVTNNSGELEYSYEGMEESKTISNKAAAEKWGSWMYDAILQEAINKTLGADMSDEKTTQIGETIKNTNEYMGADWSKVILTGLANEGKYDFSTIFGSLSQSEVDSLQTNSMTASTLIENLGLKDLVSQGVIDQESFFKQLKEDLKGYDEAKMIAAADKAGDQKAEKLGLNIEELDAYRKILAEENEELAENRDALNEVAIANKRMEKGVKTIANGWEDFNEIMTDSTATAEDISSIMPEINEGLQDILNIDDKSFELLPANFAKDNWNLITDVMNGVEGAVDDLRDKAGESILLKVEGVVDPNGKLIADIQNMHDAIASYDDANFSVGVALDPVAEAAFYDSCKALVNAAGMTKEQVTGYFGSMGYNVEFDDNPQTVQEQVTDLAYFYDYYNDGEPAYRYTIPVTNTVERTVDVPTIKTITPNGSYGGGIGVNTTAPKSATSGKSKGGGGSKKKSEKIDKKRDAYKTINSQIKQTENDLVKLEKERERLSGGKLIQNLNKQLKNLEQQKKLQEEKLQIAYEEERKLRQEIQQAGEDGYAFGIQFDAEGNITNYDQIAEQELAALRAATDKFNASAQEEADQDAYDKAKERYEKFEELIDEYYDLHDNTISDIENQIQDLYDQVIEMQVEKFTMDIELQTNFADIKNEWLELRDSILYSEKAFGQSAKTAMSGLKDSMAGVYDTLADVEYMQGELAKIKAGQNSDLFGNNEKIANETINETIGKTQEWVQNSLDYIEAIEEAAISAMDEIITLQGEMIDSYDNLISALEHKMSLKELIGGDSADTTEELQETFNIQLGIAKTAKKNLDDNRKYLAENGEWLKENNPEEYLNYVNNVLEAEEQVFSSVEEAITTLNDLFDKGIENMLKEVETAYAGALGWEELSTRWENDQELADLYLTSVQKEYELQKMLNKVNQDILDKQYDSIYAQQKLNDFKEIYIKMLEKEGDLTQAQVDRMNKMYELTLLQIALEEAKNNKSSMKLTRDSQGNYVYQYATDEAEVAKREQELADKRNEIYKQDVEDTKSAISDYISAGKDAQSEYMDLFESEEFKRYMELSAESVGKELTPEEQAELDATREKAYDMLAERAQTSAKQMEAQRKSTLEGINNILKDVDLQEIDWTQDYDTIVNSLDENQLDALLDAGIDLRSSAFKSLFGFNSNTYLQDILSSENGVWNGYLNAVGSYGNNLSQVLQAVGSENLDSYYDNVDLIYQEVQKLQEEISQQSQQAAEEFLVAEGLWEEAIAIKQRLEEDMKEGGRLDKIMDSQLGTLYDELVEIKKELGKQTELLNPNGGDTAPTTSAPTPSTPAATSTPSTNVSSQGNGSLNVGDTITFVSGRYWSNASLSGRSGTRGLGKSATITKIAENGRVHIQADGGAFGWVDISQISGYNTGGYTGHWFNGSRDGRLAFLHQKELILNEKDTPRILDAVKLVREISAGSIIKDFEAQMRNTLSSLENQLIGTYANIEGMAAAAKQSTDQMLEQAVHIDASFPGVRDAREIEEALNNLVNVASQYAYENNK